MAALSWPLLRKELRQSLRARAALLIENLYVLALALWAGVSIALASQAGEPMWQAGRHTFWQVAHLQATLLALVGAALAAAAITTEREQKTEDLLLAAPVRVRQIVRSKLAAAAAIVLAFLTLSVPIAVICLFLGGLTWQEIGHAYLATAIWLLLALAIGLLSGALFRRTIAAVPLAVVAAFLLDLFGRAAAFGRSPFAALGGSGALSMLQQETPPAFFRLPLPVGLATALMCLPLAAALLDSALDRVRLPHRRCPVAQRAWFSAAAFMMSSLSLGATISHQPLPESPPWDSLLMPLLSLGTGLVLAAVVFASQGLRRRDHQALAGRRLPLREGLLGAGPRAGARWVMLLAGLLLSSSAVAWLLAGPPLGVPAWRVGLGLACLISGVWLACLLAQLAAFWRLLPREWQRRAVAALLVALVFAGPPLVAWRLWGGQRIPPPAAVVLLLTDPIAGCILAFDPVAPLAGSQLAARADAILPLGVYPLGASLLLAAALCLLLRRQRRRLQAALTAGLAPPERELEEADAAA